MHRLILVLTVLVAGCRPSSGSRLPTPTALSHCFVLNVIDSAHSSLKIQLPRGLNLGTTGPRGTLYLGSLVPDTGDLRALWRLLPPVSLIVDCVPASTGMAVMDGLRLYTRVNDSVLTGKAVLWSDEIGSEVSVPIAGWRVSCPAGA